MNIHTECGVPYLTFKSIDKLDAFRLVVSTRHGGVSKDECSSMNLGTSTDDKWENVVQNYRIFCIYAGTSLPDSNRYFATMNLMVDDIIKYADLAIEGKNSASANLRFGHDYYLLGLLATTNFNEIRMDHDYSDIDKLAEVWRGYQYMTMASNMQFVFYRSKKEADILVRILENENDITLPIGNATAPFYKWSDVCDYLQKRVSLISE